MPPIRKAAHVPTATRQASIGDFFTKRAGPAPPSVSKSRLPKYIPEPTKPKEDAPRSPSPELPEEFKDFPYYPVTEGDYEVDIRNRGGFDYMYEESYQTFGTSTRRVYIWPECHVNDEHLHQIAAMSLSIRQGIKRFIFQYFDSHAGVASDNKEVTDAGIIRLARKCPNITHFILPGLSNDVTDEALITLFRKLPKLTHVEISGTDLTGSAFEALLRNENWAPNLKMLRVNNISANAEAMKPLLELGKARPKLVMHLITIEEKEDYPSELEYQHWDDDPRPVIRLDVYVKGMKLPSHKVYKYEHAYRKLVGEDEDEWDDGW